MDHKFISDDRENHNKAMFQELFGLQLDILLLKKSKEQVAKTH